MFQSKIIFLQKIVMDFLEKAFQKILLRNSDLIKKITEFFKIKIKITVLKKIDDKTAISIFLKKLKEKCRDVKKITE